jgi:hypothetical protein
VSAGYAIEAGGRDLLLASAAVVPVPAGVGSFLLALTFQRELAWLTPPEMVNGSHVPLASASVQNGQVSGSLDTAVRRYVRRVALPYLSYGVTEPGNTGWHDHGNPPLWVYASVDTSAAGFVFTPQYFASLSSSGVQLHLSAVTASSFLARIPIGNPLIGVEDKAKELESQHWTISWIGIEGGSL